LRRQHVSVNSAIDLRAAHSQNPGRLRNLKPQGRQQYLRLVSDQLLLSHDSTSLPIRFLIMTQRAKLSSRIPVSLKGNAAMYIKLSSYKQSAQRQRMAS
jgi:hypothetical protein